MTSKAFAPGNVSCIFCIVENKNPLKKHSLGVGFTVNKGAIVSVKKSKNNKIFYNNKLLKFPTVLTVKDNLIKNQNAEIIISSQLPLGAGFGISGAATLATAYAINKEFRLGKKKKDLALIAHHAEVANSTGLGDVGGQFNGGFMIKHKKGKPLYVEQLPIKEKYVYYKVFSKLDTKKVITNPKIKYKINKAGYEAMKKILLLKSHNKKNLNLKKIIEISKKFSVDSGLLKNRKVINLINKIERNHGSASMIMLGNAVYSDKRFKGCGTLKIVKTNAKLL